MTALRKRFSITTGILVAFAASTPPLVGQSDAIPADSAVRASVLRTYDRDNDGRLGDAEREAMRQEIFAKRLRDSQTGRGRGMMQFPPEMLEKYDKNRDGRLDEEESIAARDGLRKIVEDLQRKYDVNRDGNIDPDEMEKIQADAAAGKLPDVPRFILQMGSRRDPRGAGGRPSNEDRLKQFDTDGDGRLSQSELEAARAGRSPVSRPEPTPSP